MNRFYFLLVIIVSCFVSTISGQQIRNERINLSGKWRFRIDSFDKGEHQHWFNQILDETVKLPGSMTTNNKGNDITVNTAWTGSIFDSSWFVQSRYERYRQPGNIKVPFWLQPVKYYSGAAWYQRTIVIPASWREKIVELFIERSHWETSVWLDGSSIGTQNSLSTAQVFHLTGVKPGAHQLTIRIDNRTKLIDVGPNSHSISDHTQTNWNGMIGKIHLTAKPKAYIDEVALYPDVKNKTVAAKILIRNKSGKPVNTNLELIAVSQNQFVEKLKNTNRQITIEGDSLYLETTYSMGKDPKLWDEFHPNLYSMKMKLTSDFGISEKEIQFGMREFKSEGTQFVINGRKTFLRGTLECAIFPKTGYPPTDTSSWLRIFRVAKSFGLNHIRFHSWCPPEAAFVAADHSGFYLQIESGSWANWGTSLGDGQPIDQYLYNESNRIIKDYGNHPSFCLMTYGNEPGGKNHVSYLTDFVNYWKKKDARRVYTSGAGWPVIIENDYHNISDPRIQHWEEGIKSIINSKPPASDYDWRNIISKYKVPTVSHEIGQWCVYPDFKEIKKYTGVLKAKNFEIFQTELNDHGLGHLADSFLLASGKLQALCYKADIEAALRTEGMGGFHLLDLHDFPGQGTALVGVLNPFWEEKGYITSKQYRNFCNSTVPLVRFPKMIYLNDEDLVLPVEVAHFGETELNNTVPVWKILDDNGSVLFSGKLPSATLKIGNGIQLGFIRQSLSSIKDASKLILSVQIGTYKNNWDFFVYPSKHSIKNEDILIAQQLDENVMNKLNDGGNVLVTLKKGSIKKDAGGNIAIGFSSIFWNTAWTNGQAPHTLGVLVNPKHPAFKKFPTDYHSNWQWWDAMTHSNAMILDSISKELKPIVRVIDDWVTARSLGLVFECKVGNGKLIVSSIDFVSDNVNRPEARQLMYSLMNYMSSKEFAPTTKIEWSTLVKMIH